MDCATGGDPALQQPLSDAALEHTEAAVAEDIRLSDDAEAWRQEVAARLERYRARRRPRVPRYPSLFLPFESLESRTRSPIVSDPPASPLPLQTLANTALQIAEGAPVASAGVDSATAAPESPELAANVIEFPRSAAIPVFRASELAEPVLDRPRIVEAPEILPPPPALGGILIEPAATRDSEKKGSADATVSPATIGQRLAAGLVDGLILGAALAAFAAIFVRLNPERPPLPVLVITTLAVALSLWCTYEFLFVIYTGSTPGLRALKLQLVRFDGSPVHRRLRRWRVLASFLSAFSLGLGFLWSVLDEDGLCWHDRITRTHIQTPSPTQ
jgi:uncharacterized RDD family membrane protein YckC